ncbi:MAG: thioredoxin reductase [Thermoleophilaceae bacterium]|jgi:thioredoxin reductase (NADPH)|nr:thioredoxin reductase [Thermoleophilaceae bacterium]
MSPIRPDVTVIGRRMEPEDHRLRDFLTRTAQPHRFLEAGSDEASDLLLSLGLDDLPLPILLDGDTVFAPASVEAVADAWGASRPPLQEHYDIVIVGAGPAGLAAAVYASSDGLSTTLIDEDVPGGQASHTSMIENFFGFPDGIGGAELARMAGRQAERFGTELQMLRRVETGVFTPGEPMRFGLAGGYEITASVAIAATGMVWRRLEVDGVDELLDRGVYYGAGRSEAAQCANDDVVVIGGGNSAGQAVLNLANAGARVRMVVRGSALAASMSAYLIDRIDVHPLIELRLESQVTEVFDEADHLVAVTIMGAGGNAERVPAAALFICIGGQPCTWWAEATGVQVDDRGYVMTGPDLLGPAGARPGSWPLDRDPLALETSIPGLFAAGDVRHGSTKRVGGAVGEGAMAVALAHHRLQELLGAASG